MSSPEIRETFLVQHVTFGRIRVKFRRFEPGARSVTILERHLRSIDGIREVHLRPVTGSLIIFFDPRLTVNEILNITSEAVQKFRLMGLEGMAHSEPCRPTVTGFLADRRALIVEAISLAVLTAFCAYSLIRSFLFRPPLRENYLRFFAILGLIPLGVRAFRDLSEEHKGLLNTFLAFTCLLAIVSGATGMALEIIWIAGLSRLLEEMVKERSRRSVRELLDHSVRSVFLVRDGIEIETSAESLVPGDIVSVIKGDRIPVDGVVLSGEATLDGAAYTGRPEPDHFQEGGKVLSGLVVVQGRLQIRAEKTGRDTQLAQALEFVEKSLANRSPSEQRVDQLARQLTKLSILTSILTFVLTRDFSRALGVQLVMACPCATALASSTAVTAALTNAAGNGVLIKGGVCLEKYIQSDCYCFDKTGALSEIEPTVCEIYPRSTWIEPQKIVSMGAMAEGDSGHPVALALKKASLQYQDSRNTSIETEEFIGRGVRAQIGKDIVMVGNHGFMVEQNVNVSYFKTRDYELRKRGLTVIYVARNEKAQGMLGLGFKPRKESGESIQGLKRLGIKEFHIISGDSEEAVSSMAQSLGIPNYLPNALPGEKATYVQQLQDYGKRVVMVGDGVNDTPAMSKAWVGVAMGKEGSEIAINAADITLSDSNLLRLVELRQLGLKTFKTVDQNYYLAVFTDIFAAVLVGAGALTPLLGGAIHLIHVMGIVANSSMLLARAPGDQPLTTPNNPL
ncbi:MAG: heavy metal translocating P-type ATPase [Desulfomonilaceae bacterium]